MEKAADRRIAGQLYVYIIGRFLEAAAKQDVRPLDEALRVLTTLRGAWADIALPTLATGTRAGR